jgi:hypothetical protein
MLYFASNILATKEAILDIAKTDFTNLEMSPNKAKIIIKHTRDSIINGIDPDRYDIILGLAFSGKILCNFDQNTASLFWNQNDVWATLVKKELKNFVYWLNEYLEINDVNNVITGIVNGLTLKLRGECVEDLLDDENDLEKEEYKFIKAYI